MSAKVSPDKRTKAAYEPPAWQRESMFERFALSCCMLSPGKSCRSKTGSKSGSGTS